MENLNRPRDDPFSIKFLGRDEVFAFAQSCIVPFHIDGRKSADTEKWILSRYLLALADARLLAYPLTAAHAKESESPDFMLYLLGGRRIGLEATEASAPEFHRELIMNERGIDNHYENRPGSMGDEQERLWASLVFDRVKVKTAKLAGGGNWNPADAYDLVIYDNGPAFVLDRFLARRLLRGRLADSPRSGFGTVSIITSGCTELLYDAEGEWRILPIAPA